MEGNLAASLVCPLNQNYLAMPFSLWPLSFHTQNITIIYLVLNQRDLSLTLMENCASTSYPLKTILLFQELISYELKSFYDQVLAAKGDILERCSISWSQFKMFRLEALYRTTTELERHVVLNITMKTISEVVQVWGMWKAWGQD